MALRVVDRYALYKELASGGMASVFLGRLRGDGNFSHIVAVKVLHKQFAHDEAFRAMFLDEANLVSRIRHPNVVATLDVLEREGELFLVMEYVHGETLARLLKLAWAQRNHIPIAIVSALGIDLLEGLHAAHEALSVGGVPLEIVHRDVSPQNILVASEGVAKVADFGIAKAQGQSHTTEDGQVKGKASYMAPEQVRGQVDRRADLYSASVVLWECLASRKLHVGDHFIQIVSKVMAGNVVAPSQHRPEVPSELDAVIMRGLALERAARFSTAREMAEALAAAAPRASAREVAAWLSTFAEDSLVARSQMIAELESSDELAETCARSSKSLQSAVEHIAKTDTRQQTVRKHGLFATAIALAILTAITAAAFQIWRTARNVTTRSPLAQFSASSAPSATVATISSGSASAGPPEAVQPALPEVRAFPVAGVVPLSKTAPHRSVDSAPGVSSEVSLRKKDLPNSPNAPRLPVLSRRELCEKVRPKDCDVTIKNPDNSIRSACFCD